MSALRFEGIVRTHCLRAVIRSTFSLFLVAQALNLIPLALAAAEPGSAPDYSGVDALFNQHCLDCHAAKDPEADFVLESFELLMKGGQSGPVIVPGKSSESLLINMLEGKVERKGKKLIMPPGKRKKLEPAEITLIKLWIDGGAHGPVPGSLARKEIQVPTITPKGTPRNPINALAVEPKSNLLAVARYREVELRSADDRELVHTFGGHKGNVNAVVFSPDGSQLFAAGGEPSLDGEVRQWRTADGSLVRTLSGHADSIYALAISPDGHVLATGSYDRKIKLWNIESGEELKTLSGHNGCVFALAFRPDGKILASASADRTLKLWDVATGERRDTLGQPLKEQYALAFASDGKRLFAGGADNRIRVWQISESAAETTNPLLDSKFAHEGTVLNLVFSTDGKTLASCADDRTVTLWDAAGALKEKLRLELQPDWPPALAFANDNKSVVVGRLDGTLGYYNTADGTNAPPPKPVVERPDPRGLQRGRESKVRLVGKNLLGLTELKVHNEKVRGELLKEGATTHEAWISLIPDANLPRGPVELSVVGTNGESAPFKLYVDDLPQVIGPMDRAKAVLDNLPVGFWATIDPPNSRRDVEFDLKTGQTLVLDAQSKSLGSKATILLTLFDCNGREILSTSGDGGTGEPLVVFTAQADGRYRARLQDLLLGGSPQHFCRLSIGPLAFVTGFFPLSAATGHETELELLGLNLPPQHTVKVKPEMTGELALPLDETRFRWRRELKVLVDDLPETFEVEPNDEPGQATKIVPPVSVAGRSWKRGTAQTTPQADVDLFSFEAKAGGNWVIETAAAQRGSPMDTKIEVLYPDGKPVQRLALQAVRDSNVTFRSIDSEARDCRLVNWEEMELNQYLYMNGEVVRLWEAPSGPDSAFGFYSWIEQRRCYFDTSPAAHALDEPCYIVEPRSPGERLVPNGLPVFPIYYANDDDSERKLGTDSKLYFTAPADGTYLIRVTDTRGLGGEDYAYRLVVRPPKPSWQFLVKSPTNLTVNTGSGKFFYVYADRIDGFDGAITVTISNLPSGFSASTPLLIPAGQNYGLGTVMAVPDAPALNETNAANLSQITGSAWLDGKLVTHGTTNLGELKLGGAPKIYIDLEPDAPTQPGTHPTPTRPDGRYELTLSPGGTLPLWVKIRRNGYDDPLTFGIKNLPQGVIIENLGLNEVALLPEENARRIVLSCASWVPDTDRWCFAADKEAGKQTSRPLLLHIRHTDSAQAASDR
jgi:hypothetical protein